MVFLLTQCHSAETLSLVTIGTLVTSLQTQKEFSQSTGGDLGGAGGRFPKKLEVGDGPCIRSPNILRSSVVGCTRKYEQSKKGVMKELFSEIVVFLVKKG